MPLHIHLFHHFDERFLDAMSNYSDQLARAKAYIDDLKAQLAASQAAVTAESDADASALAAALDAEGAPAAVPAA